MNDVEWLLWCMHYLSIIRCVLQVSLIPQGLPLFGGDVVATERSFCVYFCLDRSEREENIRFTDENVERNLDLKLFLPFPRKLYTYPM